VKITCLCEAVNEVDIPAVYDVDADPAVVGRILDGSFMSFTCTECGKLIKPEVPVRVSSLKRKFDIFLVPEIERGDYLAGKTDYRAGELASSMNRIVIGFSELLEKTRIVEAGLDDRTVEALKYYILVQADETHPDAEASVYFRELKDGKLVFHVDGLKAGEVGIVNVPMDYYEKTTKALDGLKADDPLADVIKPPYVSVSNAFEPYE
jgi:hypothetical protein